MMLATTSAPVDVPIHVITPGTAVPISVALSPSFATLTDNLTTGTVVSTVTVTMSDGSPFVCCLVLGPTALPIGLSGNHVVLTSNLSSANDGTFNTSVTATPP